MIRQVKEADFNAKTVVFESEHYISFMCNQRMLKDMVRFCVGGGSILSVDTTFELKDGLWLTDSSYPNNSLVDHKGQNPTFPGPYMWHFRKDNNNNNNNNFIINVCKNY